MKTKILLLFTLFNLIFPKSYAQTEVSSFFRSEAFRYADVSYTVMDVADEKVICESNPDRRMIPASVLKLLTTASVLETYGPDYRFVTPLLYDGKFENGTIYGNLIIKGSGDPTWGSRYFKSKPSIRYLLLSMLNEKGITNITGDIILDNTVYGTEVSSPKWIWEDMGNYYGSGIWGLNYMDNMYELSFKSGMVGSQPVVTGVNPEIPGMELRVELRSANNQKDSAYIYGAPFEKTRTVYGSIPANRSDFTIKGDMYDPNVVLTSHFSKDLRFAGIKVGGDIVTEYKDKKSGTCQIGNFSSPALREIIRIVNYNSNNLFADALLRLIAQKRKAGYATFDQGVAEELAVWSGKGLPKGGMRIFDGSGLSPLNRVTTDYMARMLSLSMKNDRISDAFYSSIPVAGKEGTVKSLFRDGSMGNRLRLKSGSMGGVLSYAGYLDKKGKRYAMVIIVNNFDVPHSEVRIQIEKWIKALDARL